MAATFEVDIEGAFHDWSDDEISVPQIIQLAGWPSGTQVIEVDADNNQRTLQPNEVVELKPGHGFAKRHRFQRG
jgi:multiubiquitin